MPKCREHCCSTSCKGAREKASTTLRSAGLHTPYSFGVNGSKRSRRTQVPTTIHPKGKAKPLDTTTRKEGGDALSVNPQGYTHQQLPSTCPWQRRFKTRRRVIEWRPENAESGSPKGKQRAGWTHRETLRVVHPSGGREQLERVIERRLQRRVRKSIFVDDQSSPEYTIEYANPCYPNNGFRLQTQSILAYGPIWVQNHMRPRQSILSKPRDGEVLLLYLKEQRHTGSAVLVQRSLARQTEELANIREPPCIRRIYPKTFGFQENQFHKLQVSRGRSPQTSMFQEDKFQKHRASGGYLREDTSNMTKWRDLRPAKSTINCRTTHPKKVLLPRRCPIYLEGIMNGSTEATGTISTTAHIQSTSRVVHLRRTECDVILTCQSTNSSKPPGITGDNEFLHDVHQYFGVVRRRIGLQASTNGLVPPEEGMRKIAVFTRLLPSMELLHPRVRVLQKIILQPISNHGVHKHELCAIGVLRPEDGCRLSLQCESKTKNSCFRAGQHITYNRFQQIQVIFTSQTYKSCHPLTCEARILNLLRSINLNKPQAEEYPLDSGLSRGNRHSSRFKHGPDLRRTWGRKITGAMPCPGEAC
ncbi:LOW QUALITY PROTEIN: hypothetical protein HID58_055275 [Brassica napus]|uniref:Uncharacterized protein n=1 Tax=Brassica napus TaxID=3708 RepID=A0ABQ8AK35_BRANA|nr:LOW QUALITY PROTEIN: hypothetical protein HID58_055275 [Brassica napus]